MSATPSRAFRMTSRRVGSKSRDIVLARSAARFARLRGGDDARAPCRRVPSVGRRTSGAGTRLARISHQLSAADANLLAVTRRTPSSRFTSAQALVSTTPSAARKRSFRPCALSQRHLDVLATKVGEICALETGVGPCQSVTRLRPLLSLGMLLSRERGHPCPRGRWGALHRLRGRGRPLRPRPPGAHGHKLS